MGIPHNDDEVEYTPSIPFLSEFIHANYDSCVCLGACFWKYTLLDEFTEHDDFIEISNELTKDSAVIPLMGWEPVVGCSPLRLNEKVQEISGLQKVLGEYLYDMQK